MLYLYPETMRNINFIVIKYLPSPGTIRNYIIIQYFNDHLTNVQKTWIGINQLICRNKRRCKPIVALKRSDCNELIHNSAELPNVLNDVFSSVVQKLAASVPTDNHHFSEYLPTINSSSSFFFEPVSSLEIETEILPLPSNKAHGLYSCPIRALKCSRGILSLPLAQIMNISVTIGQYPSKLKHAKIIPSFKGGDETDPSNYCLISLLSLFNRLFEKIMYNRLKSYIEQNGLLYIMVSVVFVRRCQLSMQY